MTERACGSELAAFWSWRMHAACRSVDSALFFGGDGERPPARRRRERRAKAVCATCPVLLPCRAYALVRREAYGVWGGLSERDRARVLGDRGPPSTANDYELAVGIATAAEALILSHTS